jgi:hypothetical protein
MIANEENVLVPVVFLLARRARRKRERALPKTLERQKSPIRKTPRGATVTNHLFHAKPSPVLNS